MARIYKHGSYIFPPRPEYKIKSNSLKKYDNGTYFAQPKLNGSNCTLYINKNSFNQRNRHKETFTNFKLKEKEILSLYRGKKDLVVVGEYMNKSQKDKNGNVFNNKFVIFDILVYNGSYLIGTTFKERYELLKNIYKLKDYDDYLYQISENIFLVKSFDNNFEKKYNSIIKINMLEGLVLKRKDAKLEKGSRPKNNINSQLKCRKATRNYEF